MTDVTVLSEELVIGTDILETELLVKDGMRRSSFNMLEIEDPNLDPILPLEEIEEPLKIELCAEIDEFVVDEA